jgi:hypothetical protein
MLGGHERRTLGQIQADPAASDPESAKFFSDVPTLIWAIAATAALLTLLSRAIRLAIGAFLWATVAWRAGVSTLVATPNSDI